MTSALYRLARLSADLRAIRKGPHAILRRLVNKAIGRGVVSRMWVR